MLASRSRDKLQAVAEECVRLGAEVAQAVQYHAGEALQSEALVPTASKVLGGLDVLVLNHVAPPLAGDYRRAGNAVQALKDVAEINFYSYVSLAQAAENLFKVQYQVWPVTHYGVDQQHTTAYSILLCNR